MSSINCYLSDNCQKYNDDEVVINPEIYKMLTANGIDKNLSLHVSNLLFRDPLVVFKEKLKAEPDFEHFEQFNSTNWNSMRLKPPTTTGSANIGWRVEFRPTELQFTDFQNAAFLSFIMLLTRAILHFKLNMAIPITKLDENIQTAQKRGACLNGKFYFRTNVFDTKSNIDEYSNLTINEIINGNDMFPGLLKIVKSYLATLTNVDLKTRRNIDHYLQLFKQRANGSLMTPAAWIRKFVMSHPDYKQDSNISEEINYDLMWKICLISSDKLDCKELTPVFQSQTKEF